MVLGGCGNGADGAQADQFNGGSSTGQRQQHGGRPLDWEGNGTANRNGSGNHDASASGSQSSWKDYATALTDAIAKILDPKGALSAIDEVSKFRECQGRFGTRLAQEAAARMEPTQWWFQFGGDVPALQKSANESLLTMCLI
ncbi:uncharacterized protein [Triticum aestivum]|uniref:uncharacterized protein isoform X3 n=1 Tax=Triticum aestivum TaxID=4565 RepID=UPI001D024F7E|nr:uncharacterized protein LOC123084840 isoform X3 [Triticum aestivum]